MKKLFILSILFLGLINCAHAQQKAKKVIELTAKKVTKSRGENPNIKKDVSLCDIKDVPVAKPAKSRGDYCAITFDNWTGYYILVYVDGIYRGMVSPWSQDDLTLGSGYTTVYCRTPQSTYEWSGEGNCDGEYTFKTIISN
jgi:hypothetical protein